MEKRNSKPILPQAFPMFSGDGPHSYARNSSIQKLLIDDCKEKTREVISAVLDLENHHFKTDVFKIVDFGCSIGPNTFYVIQNIIDMVKQKYEQEYIVKPRDVEFHVFFNDLSDNDFNNLFKNLPPEREYFVAGVPGSFYGQLFPKNSLHIGHTSTTLQWLSKAPKEVCKLNSKPYKAQFERDMDAFFEARSQELVPGGLMIILGLCSSDGVPFHQTLKGALFDLLSDCLIDITNPGTGKTDSFNFPIYFPYYSDLREAIERNGCFSIEMMKEIKYNVEVISLINNGIVSSFRAVFNGALVERYGEDKVDELFDRFGKKLIKNPIDFSKYESDTQCLIILKRM